MPLALADFELPARLRPARPLTDLEIMRFCTDNVMLRVERDANGDLILMSPTGLEGSNCNFEVCADLAIWTRLDGRGKAFDSNGGFTLPDGSLRSPDAAWVSLQRWNALPKYEREVFGHIVPEFVIEIRSKSDPLTDLKAKMELWIANGVEVAWMIDPYEQSVTIYRPGDAPEYLAYPTSVQGTGPVAGFELVMSTIWPA